MTAPFADKKQRRRGKRSKNAKTQDDAVADANPNLVPIGNGTTRRPHEDQHHDEQELPLEQDENMMMYHAEAYPEQQEQPWHPELPMLSDETRAYFKSVEDLLQEHSLAEKTEEDRALFLQNIFEEVDGNELALAGDFDGSRILEKLLQVSEDFYCRVFMDRLRGRFSEMLMHRFASHVVQTLLCLSVQVVAREMDGQGGQQQPTSEDSKEQGVLLPMKNQVLDMCEELSEHWSDLMMNTYGSHLLRLILNILGGNALFAQMQASSSKSHKKATNILRSKSSKNCNDPQKLMLENEWLSVRRPVPMEYTAMLKKIVAALVDRLSETEMRTLSMHPIASPVLQALLVLHSEDKMTADVLVDKILMGILTRTSLSEQEESQRQAFVDTLIKDQVGSHLFEKILQVAAPSTFQLIYAAFFQHKMVDLARHPIANYVVQNVLDHVQNTAQVEIIAQELVPEFESLLFRGRTAVVKKFVDTCSKFQVSQKAVMKSLQTAFGADVADAKNNFIRYVMALKPAATFDSEPFRADATGVQLVQSLLTFSEEHNGILVSSFLSIRKEETIQWTKDPSASRAFESFLTEKNIGLKIKRKILRNLEGYYAELALDKYGSHLVDKCWAIADLKQKETIADELLIRVQELASSFYGRMIVRNCRLNDYKRKREEWLAKEEGIAKKKRMFADFLDGSIAKHVEATAKDNTGLQSLGMSGKIEEDGETDMRAMTKFNEIDMIFKKKNQGKSQAPVEESSTVVEEEQELMSSRPKKQSSAALKDIGEIISAIADSTGKKKKKQKLEHGATASSTTEKPASDKSSKLAKILQAQASTKSSKKQKEEERRKKRKFAS